MSHQHLAVFLKIKCKYDYKGAWLIFKQKFSIQMTAFPLKVAVLGGHMFFPEQICCLELARVLWGTSERATVPCLLFECWLLSVDFLYLNSPAFGRIFSKVAHKLPFKAFPQIGAPRNVSKNGRFFGIKNVTT
jgi:hypothetical protein